MSARGAGFLFGGFASASVWVAVNGWPSALAYAMGLVVGPCIYTHRLPWQL